MTKEYNSRDDKGIIRVRLRFIDLIKSFFAEPPDAERLSRWRGIFHALVLLLDFLATLIRDEKDGYDTTSGQALLVTEFLVPFVKQLEDAARRHDSAAFYLDCISFTGGYLELEQHFLA